MLIVRVVVLARLFPHAAALAKVATQLGHVVSMLPSCTTFLC